MKNILLITLFGLGLCACGRQVGDSISYDVDSARVVIEAAIADTIIPGAVLCVVEEGKIVYTEAYGHRSVCPEKEVMTANTIFYLKFTICKLYTAISAICFTSSGVTRSMAPMVSSGSI